MPSPTACRADAARVEGIGDSLARRDPRRLYLPHYRQHVGGKGVRAGPVCGSARSLSRRQVGPVAQDSAGAFPSPGRLAADVHGRLFGVTTSSIDALGLGTVFMMQRASRHWHEQVIYRFNLNPVFYAPGGNIVLNSLGNLCGCAPGLSTGSGGVFRLAPPAQAGDEWSYSILYQFGQHPYDPMGNACSVTLDPVTGRLFGVSYFGGAYGDGTVWELDPPATAAAAWTEIVLHSFDGSLADGANPEGAPYKLGNSFYGGNASGIVYRLTPESKREEATMPLSFLQLKMSGVPCFHLRGVVSGTVEAQKYWCSAQPVGARCSQMKRFLPIVYATPSPVSGPVRWWR